jgi:hypothetical protein
MKKWKFIAQDWNHHINMCRVVIACSVWGQTCVQLNGLDAIGSIAMPLALSSCSFRPISTDQLNQLKDFNYN